jgi:hypothetical protein
MLECLIYMLFTTESLAFQGGDGRESLLRHRMEIYKLGLKYKCTVPRGLLPPRQAGPRQLKNVMPLGWGC